MNTRLIVLSVPLMLSVPGYVNHIVTPERIIRDARIFVEFLKNHGLCASPSTLSTVDEDFVLYVDELTSAGQLFCAKGLNVWDEYLEDLADRGAADRPETAVLARHLARVVAPR